MTTRSFKVHICQEHNIQKINKLAIVRLKQRRGYLVATNSGELP